MKDKGLKELQAFKKRAKQLEALGRIAPVDASWLVERTEEMERYINRMAEKPDLERRFL